MALRALALTLSRALGILAFLMFTVKLSSLAALFLSLTDGGESDRSFYGLLATDSASTLILAIASVVLWQGSGWVATMLAPNSEEVVAGSPTTRFWARMMGILVLLWSFPRLVEYLYLLNSNREAAFFPTLIQGLLGIAVGVMLLRPFSLAREGFFDDREHEG